MKTVIPADYLKTVANKRELSESELEVLSIALEGNTSIEISEQLKKLGKIVSPDAVRQRLRSIYKKFDLDRDSSRRKFAKLQNILAISYQEYQTQTSIKKVLFLWSGDGKYFAEGLKNTIFNHERLESWLSGEDIASEKLSFPEFQTKLRKADIAICCLTRNLSTCVNFYVGYLFGSSSNFKLMRFNQLSGPLANIQSIDGTKKEELVDLLNQILGDDMERTKAWVNRQFLDWEKVLKRTLRKQLREDDLVQDIDQTKDAAEGLKENPYIRSNRCFRQIIIKSLSDISYQLKGTDSSASVPAALYPHHLISLQKMLQVKVKALALVDREEQFWSEQVGREIKYSAIKDSIRVFAFMRPEDLERNFTTLQAHADRYDVRGISYTTLIREFPQNYSKNFSIIIDLKDQSKVLAEYLGKGEHKVINFSAHSSQVFLHEKTLDKIINMATKIPNYVEDQDTNQNIQGVRENIFRPEYLSAIAMKPIEMSAYVDVEDYDQHEEKHAYYIEMMNEILNIIQELQDSTSKSLRVLELGAGTGIFTKRLEQIPNIEITAVELDTVCFNKLAHKFKNSSFVKVINADSCTYTEEQSHSYDYIVSSFADHHIKFEDKEEYFQNCKYNLKPNGVMIVGDEFLPSHKRNNRSERENALKIYHNHIIDIAKKEGEKILAKLEEAALNSGLNEQGDFKLSCEQYESLLLKSNLTLFLNKKIGPLERNDVGGVYVYGFSPTSIK